MSMSVIYKRKYRRRAVDGYKLMERDWYTGDDCLGLVKYTTSSLLDGNLYPDKYGDEGTSCIIFRLSKKALNILNPSKDELVRPKVCEVISLIVHRLLRSDVGHIIWKRHNLRMKCYFDYCHHMRIVNLC